ncbi:MAG: DNA-processing protein DprA [Deinococcales bacterium]
MKAIHQQLKHIYDPPMLLYVLGKLPGALAESLKSIAIVGTREASDYGLETSRRLAYDLAAQGVAVISGLALGVDSKAHEGCLAAGGETVAVLETERQYHLPQRTISPLAKKITEQGGAVMSEYRIGTSPQAHNFPGRNRIINGLARGVVVVEGSKRSGAMITADYALKRGAAFSAFQGGLATVNPEGTLNLLKQGAILLQMPAIF